jgi:hypothetical protein
MLWKGHRQNGNVETFFHHELVAFLILWLHELEPIDASFPDNLGLVPRVPHKIQLLIEVTQSEALHNPPRIFPRVITSHFVQLPIDKSIYFSRFYISIHFIS